MAIEKLLKAIHAVVQNDHAPPIHNLLRLAKLGNLALNLSQEEQLVTITSFNIEGRYPDFKKVFVKNVLRNILMTR
ncbi:MAG: HEPN domain-containing protein [Deltaproteobacteria bacterium]|nr:MAG: HEPN domain-containing protein [Deltaproteobacteria bacterium]